MAELDQSNQQDPEAIRRALLAKFFGIQMPPAPGQQPGQQPTAQLTQPRGAAAPEAPASTPFASQAVAQGTAGSGQSPTSQPAVPMTSAAANKPPAHRAVPTSITAAATPPKPAATPTTANDPSNLPPPALTPPPHVLTEEEFGKQNPAPAHTPYEAPDLKHRILMGLFAGMQAFGKDPGAGERMLDNYLGDIRRNEEAESNYPAQSAADAHKRYMDYIASQGGPLDIEELRAKIAARQAQAREANARADATRNPQAKPRLVKIADPTGTDPHGIPAQQNIATGEITDQEGKVIPNAKLWEPPQKTERPFNLDEQEFEARQALRSAKTPDERASAQARIDDIRASRQKPEEPKSAKDSKLTPGQKATESRKYEKALDDIETERRLRESGTYTDKRTGELLQPMTNDELLDRKQRAEDEYKDTLEAAGEKGVQRFNYRTGKYEGGEQPENKNAKPMSSGNPPAKPKSNAAPAQHQVGDEVMYQGKRHRITGIQNGKATLQPLE
jgi:hypothetical protein